MRRKALSGAAKSFITFVVAAVLFLLLFLSFPQNYAEALLPDSFYDNASSVTDANWQFSEEYLNLDKLGQLTQNMLADTKTYDFSAIENNPIVIAVIDSGVNVDHDLMDGEYDSQGEHVDVNGVGEYDVFYRDEDTGSIICRNTVTKKPYNSFDVGDDAPDMHGTHVCGIIASLIHKLNLEKYIKIMPIKAGYPYNNGTSFYLGDFNNAVEFAIQNGADIVNMSLGLYDSTWGNIFSSASYKDKAVYVAAAGNDGKPDTSGKFYPAANDNVIGVMNYTKNTSGSIVRYNGSNYGSSYQISAPGTNIYSANGNKTDGYKNLTGTSMASPIVSFAGALLKLRYSAMKDEQNPSVADLRAMLSSAYNKYTVNAGGKNEYEIRALDMCALMTRFPYAVRIKTSEAEKDQILNSVRDVRCTYELMPSDSELIDGEIKWYTEDENGDKQLAGTNESFTFKPKNEIGNYPVYAEFSWTDDKGVHTINGELVVNVDYPKINAETAKILPVGGSNNGGGIVVDSGSTLKLTVENIDKADPFTLVQWYVNDTLDKTGHNYEFNTSSVGTFIVSVKVNGATLEQTFTVTVREPDTGMSPYIVATIVVVSLLVAGVIVAISVISVSHNKRYRVKKTDSESDKK